MGRTSRRNHRDLGLVRVTGEGECGRFTREHHRKSFSSAYLKESQRPKPPQGRGDRSSLADEIIGLVARLSGGEVVDTRLGVFDVGPDLHIGQPLKPAMRNEQIQLLPQAVRLIHAGW